MQAEGPELPTDAAAALPRPAPPCRRSPPRAATPAVMRAQPSPSLRSQGAPTQKRGCQQWAQWAPPRRALAESSGLQAPHWGGLGRVALLGGAALPCGWPHPAPLLPRGNQSPSPSQVPTSQSLRGARTASTTFPTPPCPGQHGSHRSTPWLRQPEPAWAAPSSASAPAPAWHALGSPPCLSGPRAPSHWTAPSAHPTPRT